MSGSGGSKLMAMRNGKTSSRSSTFRSPRTTLPSIEKSILSCSEIRNEQVMRLSVSRRTGDETSILPVHASRQRAPFFPPPSPIEEGTPASDGGGLELERTGPVPSAGERVTGNHRTY